MQATSTEFREISKEEVSQLNFPKVEVLTDPQQRVQRQTAMERALALGNLERVKVKIYFEDDREKLFVDTTVWGVTKESIILKKGVVIPHQRVYQVV